MNISNVNGSDCEEYLVYKTNVNFTCPYCGDHSTITNPDMFERWSYIDMQITQHGEIGFKINTIRCPNSECNQLVLKGTLTSAYRKSSFDEWEEHYMIVQEWNLLPESTAKVLPEYIPKVIQEDYYQSCRIKNLSPKAAATLARRCLQGMIRDFWSVSRSHLQEEIEAIKDKVDPETWHAIDAVRSIGNIGAHMEKDVNVIVEIEPDEAHLLIGLIENLIDDWYAARYNRQQRNKAVVQLASEKTLQKQNIPIAEI